MKVTVEFLGSAFVAAGRKSITLDVPAQCTGADLLAALAKAAPNLVGRVIAEDKRSLIWPNLLDFGGIRTIADMEEPLDLTQSTNFAIAQEPC